MKEKIGEMSWSLEGIKECHYGGWLLHETGKASCPQLQLSSLIEKMNYRTVVQPSCDGQNAFPTIFLD